MRARSLLAALVALAAFMVFAGIASASTLVRSAGVYTYTGSGAGTGVSTNASVGSFAISDGENITMAADASCTGENTNSINCTVTPTQINMDLGGGADSGSLTVGGMAAIPIDVAAGSGNDTFNVNANFSSGSATVNLDDTSGDDNLSLGATTFVSPNTIGLGTVDGGTGNDSVSGTFTVNGGSNNDVVRGINGASSGFVTLNGGSEDDSCSMTDNVAEVCNGGSGQDTVDYTASNGTNVTLDTVTNDGSNGSTSDNANADGSVEIVRTGAGKDNITGSAGNDVLYGGTDNDVINAGGGDDFMDGQGGADILNGGTNGVGGDVVDYSGRAARVRVTLDASANDGEASEGDNIGSDVENIVAGFGDDSITGNSSANNLNGGAGDDSIDGIDGNDTLIGGSGNDAIDGGNQGDNISGGRGDDSIDSGPDNDTINGDGGADLIDGSSGVDGLNGNAGSDTILAKDGQGDTVNCGEATDHAVTDLAGDSVTPDCEISDTGNAGFGGPIAVPTVNGGSVRAAVVTCMSARVKAKRVLVKCTVALTHPKRGKLHADLWRGGRQLAHADRSGSGTIRLRTQRRTKPGRYRVVLWQGVRKVGTIPLKVR